MKKTLTVLTIGLGLVLTGCSSGPPGPSDNYTGKAIIERSYKNSRKTGCRVVVKLPNGQTDELRVGRRTTCDGWEAGKTIQINNGALVK